MQGRALAGQGTGPADLRSASAGFQQALDRVTRRAGRISGAAKAGLEPARRLRDLLSAAALGADQTRDALAHGRLTEEPSPIGFGGLAAGPGEPVDRPRSGARQARPETRRPSRVEVASAERRARRLAMARARASAAEAEARRAETRASRLETEADLAEEEGRRLRREARSARKVAGQRRQLASRAEADLKRL